jgi:hypothetical protein
VWNGTHAFILGGNPATNEILRFDPVSNRVERMNASLPNSVMGAATVWNGSAAVSLGGRGPTTGYAPWVVTYNASKDVTFEARLKIGLPGDSVRLDLVHGRQYNLTLNVTDDYGLNISDQVSFKGDIEPPVLTVLIPSSLYVNTNTTNVSFLVKDNVSGLYYAAVQQWNGSAWNTTFNLTGAGVFGNTSEVYLNCTLTVPSYTQGNVSKVRAVVADRAQNRVTSIESTILVDVQPPEVTGLFLEAVNGFVTKPSLNSTAQAWDNTSGLASVRIWFSNSSGEYTFYTNETLAGAAGTGAQGDSRFPWLDTVYQLNVSATDRAGNRRTVTLGVTDVQINPAITSSIPENRTQELSDAVELSGSTTIPAYGGVATDYTLIRVVRLSNSTVMLESNVTGALGPLSTYWNASDNATWPPGSYNVSYVARKGKAKTTLNATVNLTVPYNNARNLTAWRIYTTLNGSEDYDLYRITHTSGSWLNLTVTSRSGTDVDFYLQNATDPSNLGNATDSYTVKKNSTSTSEWYRWDGIQSGTVFALLVKHKNAGGTAYSITYEREMGGGSEEPTQECETVGQGHVSTCNMQI